MNKTFLIAVFLMWILNSGFSADSSLMNIKDETKSMNIVHIIVNNRILKAVLVDNSSTKALMELLSKGPITIQMHDYGNFEKVGPLGTTLPRNDEYITTEPGEIILYDGNMLVIYYATNTWTFTKLGKIVDVSPQELRNILGEGDVTVTISLPKDMEKQGYKVKITIGGRMLIAYLEDNATSRTFKKMLPLTLPMLNLYGRELAYRFPDPLPTECLRSDEYSVGDIVYWPPRHSFVILYKQTGEKFTRQHVGHVIEGDLAFLEEAGNVVNVKFELLDP
ncbi:cyclophilin-like fold protein [Pseudothermotoga lettingae]|uniref:cyclophilin-like fold protein n=1 Tax=Pseudothermotoga lettingae TaxID=177758 RepID=UPI000B125301|nr:cyclophilin-like fold protein [Pseudothermotoga lettingae]